LQVQGSGERGEIELNAKITPEELDKRLDEHGLPRFVFSGDRPMHGHGRALVDHHGAMG
jgi:hypothetical protein